jgi:putative membrane protein
MAPMPAHMAEQGGLPLLLLLPAAAAYGYAVWRLARRGDRWPVSRTLSAASGLAVLTAALVPPLVDTMDFPIHVAQHLLLAMLAPLLLALSAPVTLALRTLPLRARRRLLSVVQSRAARVVTLSPVVLVLETGGMYAYYLTPLYGYSHAHPWIHVAIHAHMFLAGCLFSWYVIGRDPMPNRPGTRHALIVLFVAAAAHDLLAKLMYAHLLPHGAGSAPHVRAGAQLMFYGGDCIDVLLAVALMLSWYARGGRQLRHAARRTPPVPLTEAAAGR